MDTLIIFNDTVSSYQLKLEYKKFAVPFTAEEKELSPKGETYSYAMNSIDGRYYTVAVCPSKLKQFRTVYSSVQIDGADARTVRPYMLMKALSSCMENAVNL